MRRDRAAPAVRKGWYAGRWNSDLTISIGYAFEGLDAPHMHARLTEVYLVARGWSDVRIEREIVRLDAGDVLVVEPGEAHTFVSSSTDCLHFVVHVPGLVGDEALADRRPVP